MFIQNLLEQSKFGDLLTVHALEMMEYLIDNAVEFSIVCNLQEISFDPALPEDIVSSLKPMTLFAIAGYSFESAYIDEAERFVFEAGFGRNNFGSVVSVPVGSILQIRVGDTVIFINLTATLTKPQKKEKREGPDGSIDHSTNVFLSNPENRELFKKK